MAPKPARSAGPGHPPGPSRAIQWASPLPPTRSGVADYASEILPHLADLAQVTLLTPPGWVPVGEDAWLDRFHRVGPEEPPPPGGASLLHLGNNPYHLWIVERLRRFGGTIVLHDSVVHHLLVEEAAASGAWDRFAEDLRMAEGAPGSAIASARRAGYHGSLDPFLLPALGAYAHFADGVIVHSRDAAARVRRASPETPVEQVPLAVDALSSVPRLAARRDLGVAEDEMLLAHLGFLTPAKGLETVLLALLALAELQVRATLLVIGEGAEARSLEDEVRRAGLGGRVRLTGWVDRPELGKLLVASDLGLVPRYPTAGETSAAALRFLAVGTPVVISGYRQFLELPRVAASRIAPGRPGTAELVRTVSGFARDRERLATARAAARRAWEEGGHVPRQAAARLLAALDALGATDSAGTRCEKRVPGRRPTTS